VTWTGGIGFGEIELCSYQTGLQRDGRFKLLDRILPAGINEGGTQVGMRVGVIGSDANGFFEFSNCIFVLVALGKYQAQIVVRPGVFRAQLNRLPKFCRDILAIRTLPSEQEAEDVVRFSVFGILFQGFAQLGNGSVPIGRRY